MRLFYSRRQPINLVVDDYVLRMVEIGRDWKIRNLKEKLLPPGLLEHGRILDDIAFFQFMQETVREWKVQRRPVRFYAPDSLIIMRPVEFPADLADEEINGHFYMELGQSLYLPFDDPIIDVYPLPQEDPRAEVRTGLLFAAPEEEVRKLSGIFEDAGLMPVACDIRSLGIYRYYLNQKASIKPEDVYLFLEVNLNAIHISIFSNHRPEFLRFTELDVLQEDWEGELHDDGLIRWNFTGDKGRLKGLLSDQIIELERIMNFYQFSIHKGEKSVSRIIVVGDFPHLEDVRDLLVESLPVPVEILNTNTIYKAHPVPHSFIPALGLSLKGGGV